MNVFKGYFLASFFLVTLGAMTCRAQEQASPAAESGAADAPLSEVVVTGSRIARSGATTPTPTVMIGADDIVKAGVVSASDLLRELPALAPGTNSESTAASFNGAGLELLDLRHLGTTRTLTLVNGRRQVGSNPNDTSVDVNTIPTPMIDRVEVITGGASAVYGADAVSGVVNFVLKKDFEGFQVNAQSGISSRGDAQRYELGAMAGTNFAEKRGNVTMYAGYTREGGIAWDARPGGTSGVNWIANPASTSSSDGIPDYIMVNNVRQIGGQQSSAFILNVNGGLKAFGFNPNGSVRPFQLGSLGLIGGGEFTNGGEAALGYDSVCPQAQCELQVPVERYLLAANGHYEESEYADLFVEGRFADTKSDSRIGSVFEIPPVTNNISIDNPYVTDSLRALMQSAGVSSIGILRSDMELGQRGQDTDRRVFELVTGSRGKLGIGDLKYEASVQYGSTEFTNTRINDIDQGKFENALNVDRNADGAIECADAAARSDGCVPINLLQPGAAITPAALAYVEIPFATETANLTQFVTSGDVTGTVGDFWGAGPISVAAGVEYRAEHSTYLVSPIDAAGEGFYYTQRQSTAGGFNVFEYYGETVVPLLKNLPFVKSLEAEAAIRRSNYSTAGETTSWKGGGSYAPTQDFRFRALVARAVRAPNVGELFSPGSEGFVTVDDPCDEGFINTGSGRRVANCAALGVPANFVSNARTINIRSSTSGNPNLTVETANTLTLGGVITPRFLNNFSATIDYYRIKISDAINTFSAQDILNNCVDLSSINNAFCQSITRSATGDIELVRQEDINVSELVREGVDLELRYGRDYGRFGALTLDGLLSRTLTATTVVAPGTLTGSDVIDFNGEYSYPKWKGRFTATWQRRSVDLTATLLWQSKMQRDVQPPDPEDNRATTNTGNYFLLNLQGGVQVSQQVRVFFGIDNVFDRLPPDLPDVRIGGASSYAGADAFSNVGRYMYVGATLRF